MKKYILLTSKKWHKDLFNKLKVRKNENWILISSKNKFNIQNLNNLKPDKVFIPHWSNIISSEIVNKFECIVFHMTDLPYGRGGSPLQNLIVRGKKKTKISALKIDEGIDSGPIYLKREMSLDGSAQKIFNRSTKIIENMIVEILNKKPIPIQQTGEPVYFKRRSPEDGCINGINEIQKIHDHIRMLDAEGYPPAYLETESFKIDFYNSKLINKFKITANVRITKK